MKADYVIIGAGSAGCAMAYRLAEAGKQVLIIEHGGSDAGPFIQMPAALSYPMNMKMYDWGLKTEPEPHLGGRVMVTPSWQGHWWFILYQRHDLRSRPCARLRSLGRQRRAGLGVC